jgi:hypothetical protein
MLILDEYFVLQSTKHKVLGSKLVMLSWHWVAKLNVYLQNSKRQTSSRTVVGLFARVTPVLMFQVSAQERQVVTLGLWLLPPQSDCRMHGARRLLEGASDHTRRRKEEGGEGQKRKSVGTAPLPPGA